MGYRFSRRIRICKGIHLNVSKSGVGISLGVRGASISTGPRGTYINTGIPGTGISYRQKIGNAPDATPKYDTTNLVERDFEPGSTFQFQIDNDGKETFYLLDPRGNPFTNDSFVRRIKRTDEYKNMVEQARKAKADFFKNQHESIVNIFKATPKLITVDDVENERNNTSGIVQKVYSVAEFVEPEPDIGKRYEEAREYVLNTIKTHKFWKKNKMISEATQEKMRELHEIDLKDWEKRRDDFLAHEREIKEEKDAEYRKEYEQLLSERTAVYEQILNPDDDYLIDTVSDVLSQVELPVDFSIDFAVNDKNIELDIDLPEIEDFPNLTCTILQSGKLSMKKKFVSDLNRDYATSVVGMAFYFAGILFNISPAIGNISVSGYTQRLSKKTGNIEDQYVYSIVFDRENFAKLNVSNIDPLQAVENFEHVIDMNSKFEMKTIEVRQSESRNVNDSEQKIQTEYYRVEPEKKVAEPQLIVSELNRSSSSVINQHDMQYEQRVEYNRQVEEFQRKQRAAEEKSKKGCLGCLTVIIIVFVLIISYCTWDINTNYERTSVGKLRRKTPTYQKY